MFFRKKLKVKIKYFKGATELEKISCGNWIDVYANEDMAITEGESAMIPLGFALELPKGYEGYLVPRSSTFKTWGLIQTNSMGIVDTSYCGNDDQWHMPVYCLKGRNEVNIGDSRNNVTIVRKGDKIGQMKIEKSMPTIEFIKVPRLKGINRGGFGTTGTKKMKK